VLAGSASLRFIANWKAMFLFYAFVAFGQAHSLVTSASSFFWSSTNRNARAQAPEIAATFESLSADALSGAPSS